MSDSELQATAGKEPVQLAAGVPRCKQRGQSSLRRKLLLLWLSLVVALLLGEVVVRLAKPGFPGFAIPQIEHRPVPGLGFEMVPDQHGYTFGEVVTINSRGFRGPEISEPRGQQRILCLGDSITFGVGVSDDSPYPRRLERLLQQKQPGHSFEVINGGVQRYFTYQEIKSLRRCITGLQPDVVTLGVYANDLGIRPVGDYVREYEKQREQAATAFRHRMPQMYILAKNSALIELAKKKFIALRRGGGYRKKFTGKLTDGDHRKWEALEEELRAFRQLANEHGFTPLVVTIPARLQVQQDFPESPFPRRVLEICNEIELPAINVHETLVGSLERGTDPYLPWDNHLSDHGHSLVATAIANELGSTLQVVRGD